MNLYQVNLIFSTSSVFCLSSAKKAYEKFSGKLSAVIQIQEIVLIYNPGRNYSEKKIHRG